MTKTNRSSFPLTALPNVPPAVVHLDSEAVASKVNLSGRIGSCVPSFCCWVVSLSVIPTEATETQLGSLSRWTGSLPQLQPSEKVLAHLQLITYTPLEAELRGAICTAFRLGRPATIANELLDILKVRFGASGWPAG